MADAEASRGHRGSANLRVEAFIALRILVAKVTIKCLKNQNGNRFEEKYLLDQF